MLHEITAMAPLVGFFFGARALGVGERVVNAVQSETTNWPGGNDSRVRVRCREWVDEGNVWAEKVGRRYGVFGFEKRGTGEVMDAVQDSDDHIGSNAFSTRLAGDAANAIVAYGLTKVRFVQPAMFADSGKLIEHTSCRHCFLYA